MQLLRSLLTKRYYESEDWPLFCIHAITRWQYYSVINLHLVKSVQIRSFFWSVFSRIRTEYRDLLHKSRYSVRIQISNQLKKSFNHINLAGLQALHTS